MNAWPELKHVYHERVVRPRREMIMEIVRRAVAAGELRADLDAELLCELLIGPILVRTILWDDSPLDDPDLPRQMVDAVLQGIGAVPAPVPAR